MVKPTAEFAPTFAEVTDYDREHEKIYRKILDAADDKTDWREVAQLILGIDPRQNPKRARHSYDSHLARARWLTEHGHFRWLRSARSTY
jgi:hypothetical protein